MGDKISIPDDATETDSRYYWLSNDIVHIYNKPGRSHTLDEATANIGMSRQIAAGVIRPLLIDMTEIKSMEREAREAYAAAGSPEYVTAVALVTRSTLSRVMGNFFIGFSRPAVPTRLFNEYLPALDWLEKYPSKQHKRFYRV